MKVLIFGSKGWIAGQFAHALLLEGHTVVPASVRVNDYKTVANEIRTVRPNVVLSCIGRTHGPGYSTIDYLEQPGKLNDNIRDNLFAPMLLAQACLEHNVMLTYIGTGCIFEGEGFTERSKPNFKGSGYSLVKGYTDQLMHSGIYRNTVLNLRIRMPIVGEVNPRNFITKITKYEKVINIPNSMTVLPSLIPYAIKLMEKRWTGTLNFTNPGAISHNEVLDMYTKFVDPSFTYENFTLEEQDKILDSKRSNNILTTTRLESMFPDVPNIHDSVRAALILMSKK